MSRKQEEALNESLMDPATRVKELARRGAESAKVDRSTSIKYYYRSAPQMKKQVGNSLALMRSKGKIKWHRY